MAPRADRQAQAAAHKLKQDLAALKQKHFGILPSLARGTQGDFQSAFADCLEDDRIHHVLYFLLTILQLQILAGWKCLHKPSTQALPVRRVEGSPDIRNIPAVYSAFRAHNMFLKDLPPVVAAAYLLLLSRLPEGTTFEHKQSQERATAAVRTAIGSQAASSSNADDSREKVTSQPAKKSLDWAKFDDLVCTQLIQPLLVAGVISSVEDHETWWDEHVKPLLEANVVYSYMGKGGKRRALKSWDCVKSFLKDKLAEPESVLDLKYATSESPTLPALPTAKQFLEIMQSHGLHWGEMKPPEPEPEVSGSCVSRFLKSRVD